MNTPRLTGILLIFGAIFFLIAAFMPLSMAVYGEPSPEKRLENIEAAGIIWPIQQVLFGAGILVTIAGVGLLASNFQRQSPSRWLFPAVLAFFASALPAIPWLYLRAVDPQGWTAGLQPTWTFLSYTFLTQIGLLLLGFVWLKSTLPRWPGWLMAGGAVLLFILTVITGDMPPFVYYLLTLTAGVVLVRNR